MLGGRDQPHDSKQASEQPALAQDLDNLFELFEKRASDHTWGDRMGQLAQGYTGYAIPSSLIAGYAAYSMGRKNQKRTILAKALKQRQRLRSQQQPLPIYATPVPVRGSQPKDKEADQALSN